MPLLNDPVGYDERGPEPEWTPQAGLRRGALAGLIAAAVLALLLAPLAAFLPYVILPWVLRTPLTFGICWLLFLAMERAAGMVGPRLTLLMLAYALLVLASNHACFAMFGIPGSGMMEDWWLFPATLAEKFIPEVDGRRIGWEWLHPYVVVAMNAIPMLVGGGMCAALKSMR